MNEREKARQLLDAVPDYKMGYVIAYLQGVCAGEEAAPDDWDLEMIERAKKENDGQGVPIEVIPCTMNYHV